MTKREDKLQEVTRLISESLDGLSENDRELIRAASSEEQVRRVLEAIRGRFHAAGKSTRFIDQQLKELEND